MNKKALKMTLAFLHFAFMKCYNFYGNFILVTLDRISRTGAVGTLFTFKK